MAVISNSNHPAALWPGVNKWWGVEYNEHAKEYPKLFDESMSKKAYEEDVQHTGFGLAVVKEQGASVSFDSESQGFTKRYTHVAYGLGYVVTEEELEDNLYAEVSKRRVRKLAWSINQTIETICANVYNRATTAGYTGGDGIVLMSSSHPSKSGNQSNILSPAADLSEASLEDLIIQIMGATNDRGLKINLMPQSLIVPRQEWFNANRILKSTLQNDTANNAVNALRATNALPGGIVVNHYLTDADQFFVRTNVPSDTGMRLIWRRKPKFEQDNDFNTGNAKAKSTFRLDAGWSDWRGVYGSTGA